MCNIRLPLRGIKKKKKAIYEDSTKFKPMCPGATAAWSDSLVARDIWSIWSKEQGNCSSSLPLAGSYLWSLLAGGQTRVCWSSYNARRDQEGSDPVLLPASDAASKFLWRCSFSVYIWDSTEAGAGGILSRVRILLVKEAFGLLLVVNNQLFLLILLLTSSCIIPYSSSINQTGCYSFWKSGLKKKWDEW